MPDEANARLPFNQAFHRSYDDLPLGEGDLFPDKEQKHIRYGSRALFDGKHEEAVWNYKQAIKINPNSFGCYLLGNIFYREGPFPEAIELYERFLRSASLNYQEEYNLAFEKICQMRALLRIEEQFK